MSKSFADTLFDAWSESEHQQHILFEHLERIFGVAGWGDDNSFDPYDTSLELRGCPNEMRATPEQLNEVWSLGFQRMWINHVDGWETYYSADGSKQLGAAYAGTHKKGLNLCIAERKEAEAAASG